MSNIIQLKAKITKIIVGKSKCVYIYPENCILTNDLLM